MPMVIAVIAPISRPIMRHNGNRYIVDLCCSGTVRKVFLAGRAAPIFLVACLGASGVYCRMMGQGMRQCAAIGKGFGCTDFSALAAFIIGRWFFTVSRRFQGFQLDRFLVINMAGSIRCSIARFTYFPMFRSTDYPVSEAVSFLFKLMVGITASADVA